MKISGVPAREHERFTLAETIENQSSSSSNTSVKTFKSETIN